LAFSPAL